MRDYSIARPQFWIGETGRYLRDLGRDAQVLGFYLFTCPASNMIGLYYLPLTTAAAETGITLDVIHALWPSLSQAPSEPLASPFEGVFARYDDVSGTVFVTEMAKQQLGERLTRRDNRHKSVIRELEIYRKTPFFNDFLERYGEAFELQDVAPSKPLRSPLQAPSKGGGAFLRGSGSGSGSGIPPLPPTGGLNGAKAPNGRKPREITGRSLDAWRTTIASIDRVKGTELTWRAVDEEIADPLAAEAIRAAGGHKSIADRSRFTQPTLETRFRECYEHLLEARSVEP